MGIMMAKRILGIYLKAIVIVINEYIESRDKKDKSITSRIESSPFPQSTSLSIAENRFLQYTAEDLQL